MILFIKLILAHLLGDFVLQPVSWVKDKQYKKIRSVRLYLHAALHGALVLLLLWDWSYLLPALAIAVIHLFIDLMKLYLQGKKTASKWFVIDQCLHLISIAAVYYWWFKPDWNAEKLLNNPDNWLLITALLTVTVVSSVLIKVVLQNWTSEVSTDENDSLNKAGTAIGILERLFTFVFVVTGNWAPIGFLLAAKSVFRFGNLQKAKDRKLTEYILIGTLLSFGMAIATGLVFNYLTTG